MLGALLIVAGVAGVAWSLAAATSGKRPLDLAASLLAALFVAAVLVGALRVAVPGFFG